jgi:hypothetical protein
MDVLALAIMLVLGTVIQWVTLMLVIPISRKLADFSFPPLGEAMLKLAAVSFVVVLIRLLLSFVPVPYLDWLVSGIAFWILMAKWFDVDMFGAVVIVVVSLVIRLLLMGVVTSLIFAAVR